jgi:GGDEF domain-containing protein
VLLAGCGRAEAEERCRRFQEAVGAIPLGISAGASVYPEDGDTYERLLARADRRMYRNKAQRKKPLPARQDRTIAVAASG